MSKQASKRVAQFNLLFTPSELRELKKRADRQTGGNVSELIRRAMFPKRNPSGATDAEIMSMVEDMQRREERELIEGKQEVSHV